MGARHSNTLIDLTTPLLSVGTNHFISHTPHSSRHPLGPRVQKKEWGGDCIVNCWFSLWQLGTSHAALTRATFRTLMYAIVSKGTAFIWPGRGFYKNAGGVRTEGDE